MNSIPNIAFKHKDSNPTFGFELLDLQHLLEQQEVVDHNPHSPHRVNFFAILIIEKGNVQHMLDFKNYELKAGDCLFISKGQVHAFSEKQAYNGKLVLFTESFLHTHFTGNTIARVSALYNYFTSSPLKQQKKDNLELISQLTNSLTNDPKEVLENLLGAHLSIYLLKTQSNCTNTHLDQNHELFLMFKEKLYQSFHLSRDAKYYAKELGVDYKRLNNASKATTGSTIKIIIDEYVMLEAKRRLASTNLSVKEISYECGFEEPTNFLKFFKKHASATPQEFRNQLKP